MDIHAPDYWFFEETADKFGMLDPTTGQITEIPLSTTANPQVDGITAGPDGTVWFTEFNTNQIGMIDTDTDQITEFPLNTPGADPYGIVEGPDGNIWFTEAGAEPDREDQPDDSRHPGVLDRLLGQRRRREHHRRA